MAIAWKDVISKPEYQQLPPDQQAAAQEQYFNEVVAPQTGDQAEAARHEFFTAYPLPIAQEQAPQQTQQQTEQQGFADQALLGAKEAGRSIAQAGVNVANIIPEVGDAVQSAATWLGSKVGLGDGTYTPAMRMSLPESLQPQTEAGKIAAQALPYVINPVSGAAKTASGVGAKAASLLAENAVGVLADNSSKNDAAALATDLGVSTALSGATRGLTNAIGAGYRAAKGQIAPEAKAAIDFAEQQGVPLHTTDLLQPQSKVGRMAQGAAENIPLVGTSGMRSTQQEARSQLVQDFANKFGDYDPSAVVTSLKQKTGTIKAAAGNRINDVTERMSGAGIQPSRTTQAIDNEVSRLNSLGEVKDSATIEQLQKYKNELLRGTPSNGTGFEQFRNLRTQFRQDVKGERTTMPTRSEAAVNRIYKAMGDDIYDGVSASLNPRDAARLRQADQVYAAEANTLKNTRLKNVLMKGDLTPEVVNNILYSNKKSEIQTLYNSVGSTGRAQMRNGIIGKAMEKSGGSPDQFLRQLNMLSNQTGIAFRGADAGYVRGLKNYLESTKQAGKASVVTPTGQQVLPWVVAGAAASNPGAAAATVSYGLLGRMYESKPIRNAMLKLANTPKNSTAFEKQLEVVNRALTATAQGAKD
ncbi:lytic transglycosylase domain-containing protein [Yersinia rochesterensis]|uniref:lytic transglycosylase domain-containing protein n=1 Tax=Yersinia rochesterensis TaxID=1604335 RepID=UPI00285324B4|nr:lytic transglycosylase domain-containing protein [Yersinia rochesterensis]MDR5020043.1 lytic transglycosylase domain-containing protein [Yersinia rochesterensis]